MSLYLKTLLGLIPVVRIDLTLVAGGNILNNIQLSPADVYHVNCCTLAVRSNALTDKSSRPCFIPIYWLE